MFFVFLTCEAIGKFHNHTVRRIFNSLYCLQRIAKGNFIAKWNVLSNQVVLTEIDMYLQNKFIFRGMRMTVCSTGFFSCVREACLRGAEE